MTCDTLCMYCSSCFFANERERVSHGDAGWRNCFNAAAACICQCCGMEVSACGRSRWLNHDLLAAVAGDLLDAYDDATCDLMECALRGRWGRARVVAKREEIVACSEIQRGGAGGRMRAVAQA